MRSLAALLCAALLATGCSVAESPGSIASPAGSSTAGPSPEITPGADGIALAEASVARLPADVDDARSAGRAITAFGLDLFRATASDANRVVSPASIAVALAMVRAGARGATADQMDEVLHGLGTDEHAAWVASLDQELADRSGTYPDFDGDEQEVVLRAPNAPFAQRGLTLQADYLEALEARFGAGLRLVDFGADPDGARDLINGWVDEQTEGRIPELLGERAVDELTRLVLVNAIYLKAGWLIPFSPRKTEPAPFTRLDGTTVDVPMMAKTMGVAYASGPGWRAIELPYVGRSLAMTVVAPDDLPSFVEGLDEAGFAAIVDALGEPEIGGQVEVALPRFSIETQSDLASVLGDLGMPDAFAPGVADLSGIDGGRDLFVKSVIHQANIDVDEYGTEAAAATAAIVELWSMPAAFRADRPFLFALRDVPTGTILFLGQVTDPSRSP